MHALIKAELTAKGWSIETLCHHLHTNGIEIGASTVRAWVDGRCWPSGKNLLALSIVFDWSLADLYRAAGYRVA